MNKNKYVATIAAILFSAILSACEPVHGSADVMEGIWVYDKYTQYEFDGKRNGCMYLEELHYDYSYKLKGNQLSMDFADEAVHDCSYEFNIQDDVLTLIGGEGTVGGTYKLYRENADETE